MVGKKLAVKKYVVRLSAEEREEPAPAGCARWTLSPLEEKVAELNIVEKASDNTIGRTLKKTFSSRTSNSNG